jgi:hypothetical protein
MVGPGAITAPQRRHPKQSRITLVVMAESFTPAELEDPLRAAKRLVLASQDMADAAEATALLIQRPNSRVLETALAVSYARPWTEASIAALDTHWEPAAETHQELHREIIRLRNKVYAHTDEELGARGVRDVSSLAGTPDPLLVSEWRTLKPELLPVFEELSKQQRTRFREAANELSLLVRRFVVELHWSPAIAGEARNVLLDELESEIFALRPTSAPATSQGLTLEIELVDPAPSQADFSYGVRRLLRGLRQWNRRLVPEVHTQVRLGLHTYVLLIGGGETDPETLNHEVLLADYRRSKDEPGARHWSGGWAPMRAGSESSM